MTEPLPANPGIEFAPGTVLAGRLKVLRRLGAGGVGAVYEVEHQLTQHRRALKVLHPRLRGMPEVVQRFLREASAAGRIGNPHIVETFDAGELESGAPWLLMELLEGEPLSELLRRNGRLEPSLACWLVVEVALAIQAAHDAGIVHRDLKPDNLFLSQRDGRPFVKVLDFGMSKFDAGLTGALQMTAEGTTLGTPLYMAPEQMRGARDVDGRADVYALGVILYEAIAGGVPYSAQSFAELAVKVLGGACPRLGAVRVETPAGLSELVHRAMAVEPAHRVACARELAQALMPFARVPSSNGEWWKRNPVEPALDQTAKRVTPFGPDATVQRMPSPLPVASRLPVASGLPVASPLPIASPLPAPSPLSLASVPPVVAPAFVPLAPPVAAVRPRRSRKWMMIAAAILFGLGFSKLRKNRVGSIEELPGALIEDRVRRHTRTVIRETSAPSGSDRKCCHFGKAQLSNAAKHGSLQIRGPHLSGKPVVLSGRAAELELAGAEVRKIELVYAQSISRTRQKLTALVDELPGGEVDGEAPNQELYEAIRQDDDDEFDRAVRQVADERAELLVRVRTGQESIALKMLELLIAEDERALDELEQVLGPARAERFVGQMDLGAVIKVGAPPHHPRPH